ncbi:hypothetical protein PCCS19_03300 [Paenibacillus sp. CCS19]|uniref:HEAT repeat domain-containing protein n=1 Tax=Paenibacillus sp. CCS19 TaxID=3158387 RepID=UPI00256169F9|nr:HEAT repeat domain-containing protein [Paenibacillus cellulosilyticus]GMK37277.1 hypothetical protein PCCS19_03300 [Paenibacillus cellulosilyticus]
MSVELLHDLQQEVRRLFIAGSALAQGDLRIAKLQPQLKKLGESAPVFNRIADASDAVLTASREDSAVKLLELATLLSAVLHTQGKTETAGELHPVISTGIPLSTDISYRRLKPLLDILTTKGQGRLEQLRQAVQDGIHMDLRALPVMCRALDETFPEIAELITDTIRTGYGQLAVPVLREQINVQGGKGDVRRLQLIHQLSGVSAEVEQLLLNAATQGSVDLKIAAISLLGDYKQQESLLLELSRDKRKEVRQAALHALASIGTDAALDRLCEALTSKDRDLAVEPIRRAQSVKLLRRIIGLASQQVEQFVSASPESKERTKAAEQLHAEVLCLHGVETELASSNMSWHRRITISPATLACTEECFALLRTILSSAEFIAPETEVVRDNAAELLLSINTEDSNRLLMEHPHTNAVNLLAFRFRAAYRQLRPSELYERFSPLLERPATAEAKELSDAIWHVVKVQYPDNDSRGVKVEDWDSRWLRLFISSDNVVLVSAFTQRSDPSSAPYLLAKLDIKAGLSNYINVRIMFALFRIRHAESPELLLQLIERSRYHHLYESTKQLIAALPRSYVPRLRAIIGDEWYYREIIEIADAIEAAPTDLIEESGSGLWRWITSKLS